MIDQRMKARDKTVRKMTKDGQQSRDAPVSGSRKKKQAAKFRIQEQSAGEGKLLEKERHLSTSRGDSRKDENGGTNRPKQKRRLQFAQEETGAVDTAKAESADAAKANAKKAAMKEHSKKGRNVQHEPDAIGKKQSKLAFENEGNLADKGKKLAGAAAGMTSAAIHRKIAESEDENAAVKGLHDLEMGAEGTGRLAQRSVRNRNRRNRHKSARYEARADKEAVKTLYQEALAKDEKLQRSSLLKKQIQKARIKREYAKAKRAEQTMGTATKGTVDYIKKIGGKVTNFFKENRKVYIAVGVLITMMFLIATSLTSCSALFLHNLIDYSGASYMSTDQAIRDADLYYTQLEANLQERVNRIESENTGYDRYRYQIDEIGHDPFILISYLSAKYEVFEFDAAVKADLDELFARQYSLSTQSSNETITETRTVRVGESLGQVVTSGYCNCPICCGQWSGGPTASGAMPQANHTIAVDAHTPTVPMGTKVIMNGVEYTVEDTGNFTQYGVDFDVYYDSHSAASAHGHQTWEAYLSDANGSNEITVTDTVTRRVLTVTLTNAGFDAVARANLDEEEMILYNALNRTFGNRNYLFDISTLPSGGDGMSYDIPPEALSDQRFANMIREAEKYLGYPYVWGGASPSTSFDCSGYVSWVINNCGNGWNVGRLTAEGLRSVCTYVSPDQAKPGDLIFFEKTYNTAGASHVGIYVGNGMMIHCGDPIHYSSINTSYWQQHFLCFGRLP